MAVLWSNDEIKILKQYYPSSGSLGCSKFINRPISAIKDKAFRLDISTQCKNGKMPHKIIDLCANDLVLAHCSQHGLTEHRLRFGRSPRCIICRSEYVRRPNVKLMNIQSSRRRRTNMILLYAHRLRVQLRQAIRNKAIGCFRFLPYSPDELRRHLDIIRKRQNNHCPLCDCCYDDVVFHIDHIIPLASADNNKDILDLFSLDNLSLLCGSCNCMKGKRI